jgi:tRNA pseudouridine55 synthase
MMNSETLPISEQKEGLLLVNKPQGKTSFSLIRSLRKLTGVQKIGHAGTLDPFATGVMVILVGKNYTRLSDQFLLSDKEYLAEVYLGVSTDTYDCDGKVVATSRKIPSMEEVQQTLLQFQGEIDQVPPMFSAKKIKGKKLYELARTGITIDRPPAKIKVETTFLRYEYPLLTLRITCSKGTYIRSIAHEMGIILGCGAHLKGLMRTRSGKFKLEECLDGKLLDTPGFDVTCFLKKNDAPLKA